MIKSMIPIVAILLVLPGLMINVEGQSTNTSINPSASSSDLLTKICLNVDEYRSMFTSILGDNSIFSRDTIARVITWVDWLYSAYNKYKWIIDFAIGAMTTLSVFLPGGPLIPITIKVITTIGMDPNMRRLIKEIMYEVWTMIPPSGTESYNIALEGAMVIVRQVTNATSKVYAKRSFGLDDVTSSTESVDWSSIIASLTAQLVDLQRRVYSSTWN